MYKAFVPFFFRERTVQNIDVCIDFMFLKGRSYAPPNIPQTYGVDLTKRN